MLSVFARIVGEVFKENPTISDAISASKQSFMFDLRAEALAISARVLGGLVLCSVIVFALIKLGQRVDTMVMMSVDGIYISMALLVTVVTVCTTTLFIIFRPMIKPKKPVQAPPKSLDFHNIVMNFIVGLNEGYERSARRKRGEDLRKLSEGTP